MTIIANVIRAVIAQSNLTVEQAMSLINQNHARRELSPEELYIFPMVLSDQSMDTYHTRMGYTTLRNFGSDFTAGRALMNSHRTGGFISSAELPIGRTFLGEVSGDPLPLDAPYEAAGGALTRVYAYIQRGLKLTDVATDDLIAGIEGATINDVSVGFLITPQTQYICSLCGRDVRDWDECMHMPGMEYDEGRAFAWIEKARGREASLVYMGANSNAVIEKAIRLIETHQLSRQDISAYEDQWNIRLTNNTLVPVPSYSLTNKNGETLSVYPENLKEQNIVDPEDRIDTVQWDAFFETWRALDSTQADRVAVLPEGDRFTEILKIMQEQRNTIASLKPKADLGDMYIGKLIERAIAARTTAEGDKFTTAEKYEASLRASNDPEYIEAEIKTWERVSATVFGSGARPTAEAETRLDAQADATKATSASYR